ncbi:MAG: type II 3-dehydroquinate dehydratase [Bacteroidia bacterium]|jgi:3-dehydroquinate dehydratase-2|nr:type II 3-dehydroquinate dehydratase [Bacteroidia bacterium]
MKVCIINGPNLNLLGTRETDVYGELSFEQYLTHLQQKFSNYSITYHQSNIEGELINLLHQSDKQFDFMLINPGGYSHTSVALADAISAITTPVIEIHISNIFARESFRHQSLTAARCKGCITGFGMTGYEIGMLAGTVEFK